MLTLTKATNVRWGIWVGVLDIVLALSYFDGNDGIGFRRIAAITVLTFGVTLAQLLGSLHSDQDSVS